MQRKSLKKASWGVRPKMFLMTAPFGFGFFGFGVFLSIRHDIEWAPGVCGVLAVLICGFSDFCLQRYFLRRIPCPQCGQKDLEQTEDSRRQQLLVCRTCQIQWDTGISNDHGD